MKTITALFPKVKVDAENELRRQVNRLLNWEDDLLHNHTADRGHIYGYPEVQFREVNKTACLFGIKDGVRKVTDLVFEDKLPEAFREEVQLLVHETELKMVRGQVLYHLTRFLPFNSENYSGWKEAGSLKERVALLEKSIAGHILNFCTFGGFRVPDRRLRINLQDFSEPEPVSLETGKGSVSFLGFNILYEANIVLPEGIGLGKGKSKGFGVNLYYR